MKVDLDMGGTRSGNGGGPTGIAGLAAYRFVQEGLTNARKHAPGTPVRITVAGGPGDGLTLELTNPADPAHPTGPGGPRDGVPGSGQGLIGLAERVALAGGRFSHGEDGAEYALRAWLPWPA